jgi:hypothetical protein
MGSLSSGRYRTVNRGAIEDAQWIDIRCLRRLGLIHAFANQSTFLRWSRCGEEIASAWVSVNVLNMISGTLRISYGGLVPAFVQTVQIVSQPCRFGGHRFYFLCPATGARVEVLALVDGRFVSRQAARLTYASQSETKLHRLYRARAKAEAKACGDDGHPRPRGRNRERLSERSWALEMAAEDLLEHECLRRFGCAL